MNKIRQILAFVRNLLDFLLNLGSHTPQKQPPHDTTDNPTEPTPPFPPLPPARLGQPLPAGGTLPPARHAGGGAGGYRGDTLGGAELAGKNIWHTLLATLKPRENP